MEMKGRLVALETAGNALVEKLPTKVLALDKPMLCEKKCKEEAHMEMRGHGTVAAAGDTEMATTEMGHRLAAVGKQVAWLQKHPQ